MSLRLRLPRKVLLEFPGISYLEVARWFGLRTGEPLVYEEGALFVPRFDRNVSDGRVERLGMNSLYAVANIPGFGAVVHHDTYCRALVQVASDPAQELREYILRDILNLALRNNFILSNKYLSCPCTKPSDKCGKALFH